MRKLPREASNPSVWLRKVLHKCSQTEEFHHFFLPKRDSTALVGLRGAVFLKGVFKTHGIYVGSRFRGIKKTCFYDFWASWRLLGRFGALLGPLLGLIFHFGLVKTEEVATGGLKSLGLAEKSAA